MGGAICLPVSGFQRRIVPSCDPLATSRALGDQSRHLTAALCPSHGSLIMLPFVHSRIMPSMFPLATIVSSGDTAMHDTHLPSLRQGFPTCSPYLLHRRIEPSSDALTTLQLMPTQARLHMELE